MRLKSASAWVASRTVSLSRYKGVLELRGRVKASIMGNGLDMTLEFINYGRDIRSSPSPSDTHNATVITKQHVETHRPPITKTSGKTGSITWVWVVEVCSEIVQRQHRAGTNRPITRNRTHKRMYRALGVGPPPVASGQDFQARYGPTFTKPTAIDNRTMRIWGI